MALTPGDIAQSLEQPPVARKVASENLVISASFMTNLQFEDLKTEAIGSAKVAAWVVITGIISAIVVAGCVLSYLVK